MTFFNPACVFILVSHEFKSDEYERLDSGVFSASLFVLKTFSCCGTSKVSSEFTGEKKEILAKALRTSAKNENLRAIGGY